MSDDKNKGEETVDFLTKMIKEDVENSVYNRPVATRFPPEPNGYLHIGGLCDLHQSFHRQPVSWNIQSSVRRYEPTEGRYQICARDSGGYRVVGLKPNVYFGSDYADQIAEAARKLIAKGKAYVCDLTPEQMTEYRGTLTEAGINSPFRERGLRRIWRYLSK